MVSTMVREFMLSLVIVCRVVSDLLGLFTQTLIQQTLVVSVVQWKGVKKAAPTYPLL